jgi:hypothetical protein
MAVQCSGLSAGGFEELVPFLKPGVDSSTIVVNPVRVVAEQILQTIGGVSIHRRIDLDVVMSAVVSPRRPDPLNAHMVFP